MGRNSNIWRANISITAFSSVRNRQKPYTDVTDEELNESFEAIQSSFGADWLHQNGGGHVLQRLWRRRDSLATTELHAFGSSIVIARALDPKWLCGLISTIRKPDENNQRGSIFEICACSYLSADNQKVVPARRNQKGFDLLVRSGADAEWYFSLKAHSRSQAERTFRTRMDGLRSAFVSVAEGRIGPTQLVLKLDRYPLEADWQVLRTEVKELIKNVRSAGAVQRDVSIGRIYLRPLKPPEGQRFAQSKLTYTVTASCQFHPAEVKNFIDKLEAAISNLGKHVGRSFGTRRVVFMRMPSTISLEPLRVAAQELIESSRAAELVVFMQPYWACMANENSSRLFVYGCDTTPRETDPLEKIKIAVQFGHVTNTPPLFRIGTSMESFLLDSHYWYQHGEHYLLLVPTANGMAVTISVKEPGVRCRVLLHDSKDVPAVEAIAGYGLRILGD